MDTSRCTHRTLQKYSYLVFENGNFVSRFCEEACKDRQFQLSKKTEMYSAMVDNMKNGRSRKKRNIDSKETQ